MQDAASMVERVQATRTMCAAIAIIAAASGACHDDALEPSGQPVATIEIAPPSATVAVGATTTFTATALDDDGNEVTGRKILWVIADSNFATISDAGVVTGRYVGTVPVAASVDGKSATAQVVVVPIPVATVRVAPASRDLTVGETTHLTAEALDARGIVLSGRTATWTSNRPNVASVNGSGAVTALAPGSAVITATVEGKSGVAAVSVAPSPVASVVVTPSSASLAVGEARALDAQPRSASGQPLAGRSVSWSTNASQVATVSNAGVVFGVSPGKATITASSEGRSGTAQIVVEAAAAQRVEITPAEATVGVGNTVQLTAIVYDTRGNVMAAPPLSWSSADTRTATVDSEGRVRGVRTGTVTITAKSGNASGTARVRVERR